MGAAELVRQYYASVDAGDIGDLVALFSPDAVYDRPGYPIIRGREELTRFYRGTRVIDSGAHTLQQVTVEESIVAVHGKFTGVLRDGSRSSLRFADFFTLTPARDLIAGRITFFHTPLV